MRPDFSGIRNRLHEGDPDMKEMFLPDWQLDDELVGGWGDGEGASTHVTIFRVVQKDDADLSQS